MPRFDGTGPMGAGPGTGRGLGPCGYGLGWRSWRRSGFNRGLCRYFGWNKPQTRDEEVKALNDYKEALEEELGDVEKELADGVKE